MSTTKHPVALIILDGWGYSEASHANAILAAKTPTFDRLWQNQPHTLIDASGHEVGLPAEQMGNSEVGHLNIGAGRVVYQEFTRIERAIHNGEFFTDPTLSRAVDAATAQNKAVHILGLLSPGGVHSHEDHLLAMMRMAVGRGATQVYLHAFLDGRDTPPKSAKASIERMMALCTELGAGRIASVCGRFYAMDRDQRWERVEQAYRCLTDADASYQAADAIAALEAAYARGETDEFVQPTVVGEPVRMESGDSLIFMNFRSDRARELTSCFLAGPWEHFAKSRDIDLAHLVTLTEYKQDFPVDVVYPPEPLENILGAVVSQHGKRQLRIAETEKYAHVTFFFNGGQETPFAGEDRILVPSPKVKTYDLMPAMSAPEVTDKLVAAIESAEYDLLICNYANADMVGHTGDLSAAIVAIETLDACLARLEKAILQAGGEMLITADHGNAERMQDPNTGQSHTAHTTNLVPFIYVGERTVRCAERGALSDIAPTILQLMQLPVPAEMKQTALIRF